MKYTILIVTAILLIALPGCFLIEDAPRENPNDPLSSTYSAASRVYMFSTSTSDGNKSGRSGLDAFCSVHKPANLACNFGIHAFVSVSSSDQIVDMPSKYNFASSIPIFNSSNQTIKSSYAAMLSQGPDLTMQTALGISLNWFSGSFASGQVDPSGTCTQWTSVGGTGQTGNFAQTDSTWLASAALSCAGPFHYICLCLSN